MSLVKRITIDGTSYDIAPANMDSVPTADSENPISSGGIKSYLESSYVPLSATQAPVTGLTDILTPVNLLPNSDFSRAGGYASSQTWETAPVVGSNNVYITSDWYFRNYGAQLTNITVTRSTNLIRFQATSSSSVLSIWATAHAFTFEANKKYTITGKMVGTAANGTMRIAVDGSPSSVYSSEDGFTFILFFTTTQTRSVVFYIDAPGNGDIDVTCSDIAIYEGEFKNPPITTSLDVKPGNQFELKHNALIFTRSSGPHWFRLLTIPNAVTLMTNGTTKLALRHYCEAILAQGYTSGNTDSYSIHKIICGFALTKGLNFSSMALKVDSIISGEFITYSKFRLAIDNRSKPSSQTNVPLYIEGYYAGTVNASPDYLYVEVDTDSIIEAGEGAIGDDDILIGSEVPPNKISTNITMPTLS